MYRRSTPVLRQQRCVNVEHAEPGHTEQRVRQNPPVRGHDTQVRPERSNLRKECILAKLRRLQHGNATQGRELLRRRRRDAMPASFGTIRLGHERHNRMTGLNQRAERRDRECRRPEIHDAQRRPLYHRPVRLSLWIFRTMRSFLMPLNRSTKTVPSRWSISC